MIAVVDKNIPMPPRANDNRPRHKLEHEYKYTSEAKWPWREMDVGDSFFAPGYVQNVAQRSTDEPVLSFHYVKKSVVPGSQWASRIVTENGQKGLRVWRTG